MDHGKIAPKIRKIIKVVYAQDYKIKTFKKMHTLTACIHLTCFCMSMCQGVLWWRLNGAVINAVIRVQMLSENKNNT